MEGATELGGSIDSHAVEPAEVVDELAEIPRLHEPDALYTPRIVERHAMEMAARDVDSSDQAHASPKIETS
jgi:hypothetical protein